MRGGPVRRRCHHSGWCSRRRRAIPPRGAVVMGHPGTAPLLFSTALADASLPSTRPPCTCDGHVGRETETPAPARAGAAPDRFAEHPAAQPQPDLETAGVTPVASGRLACFCCRAAAFVIHRRPFRPLRRRGARHRPPASSAARLPFHSSANRSRKFSILLYCLPFNPYDNPVVLRPSPQPCPARGRLPYARRPSDRPVPQSAVQ